ncbi:MAG: thiosulfate oxidation carrier complex protein SoxZ [Campylobacterota bacterium]|nr:thiosulfate oxidation carrier complex protein SoxZ [Campylobacterota bacterium]
MANKITAVKVKIKNGVATAKMAFSHPMMTYNQAKSKTGNRDDANFITHITGKVGTKTVLDISTSQFFSKNPIFKSQFKCDTFKIGTKLSGRQKDNIEEKLKTKLERQPTFMELNAEIDKLYPNKGDFITITATDRKGNTYIESVELATRKKKKR